MNWLLKYKPKDFDDILGQEHTISMIKNNIDKLPHMIFYGPPGVAKTSVIDIVAAKIYGKNKKQNTLFLNASDERGIDTVRNKIKNFAKQKIYSTIKNEFQFKLIILDEADSMTSEAQTALRRIMEANSQITRFCLICNYVNKIINPISSRCAIFRFKKISTEFVTERLEYICDKEGCRDLKQIVATIARTTKGDLRQSIIIMESIYKCLDKTQKNSLKYICNNFDIDIKFEFKDFDEMKEEIDNLFFKNCDIDILLVIIKNKILESNFVEDKKLDLLIKLNHCQLKIYQNCDEKIQLYNFFINLII